MARAQQHGFVRPGRSTIGRRLTVATVALTAAWAIGGVPPAAAFDFLDGRVELHGSVETQFRTINHDFRHEWDLSQWRNVLALELEVSLVEEPIGWLDDMSLFVRTAASYDCVWRRGCGIFPTVDAYGNRANGIPSRYRDGKRNGFVGDDPALNPVNAPEPYHQTPALSRFADAEDADIVGVAPGKDFVLGTGRRERTSRLVGIGDTPPFEILATNFSFNTAFAPLLDYRFAIKQDAFTTSGGDSSGVDATVLMWRPKDKVQNLGLLSSVENTSFTIDALGNPSGLPFRPMVPGGGTTFAGSSRVARGLFNPSAAMRRLDADHNVDRYDQNFTQTELEWNFGASQDEYILREAYLDMNFLDARLFVRLGKQTIIWGKTELFRNQDQFNPQDLALVTLPDLEESRIPLWALRAIWSFWNVGPLMDVRLEVAWMLDDFEPNDVGRCGEPYAPLPVCDKTFGVFQHGVLGAGLVGETRPPNWWEDFRGVEIGARLEFRWSRFSFAITDFWHYEDAAVPRIFNQYSRRVDPESGRMIAALAPPDARCETGAETWCLEPGSSGPNNALGFSPQNRQLFDVICASSVRFFSALDPSVCALTVTNSEAQPFRGLPAILTDFQGTKLRHVVSATAAGNATAAAIINTLAGATPPVVLLNQDDCDDNVAFPDCTTLAPVPPPYVPDVDDPPAVNDSPFTVQSAPGVGGAAAPGLRDVLTDHQEALLGCGAFFQTDCDRDGVDLFNAEASVLLQAWPGFRPGGAVATRFFQGRSITLPGARSPFTFTSDPAAYRYHPQVDGCIGDFNNAGQRAAMEAQGVPVQSIIDAGLAGFCNGANLLDDDLTAAVGRIFRSELEGASYNALQFVVALDADVPGCDFPAGFGDPTPINCPTLQDFFSVTQTTRPELRAGGNGRFGRRDFAWAGAGEIILEYDRVNTLGAAMDFSEDVTLTNWSLELTWTADKDFVNSEVPSLKSDSDVLALTVSVDRPTFIRFLNFERTFFFNMQWFFEYIPDHEAQGDEDSYRGFAADGPWTALGVFTLQTGFFQDRLQPSATFVYDVRSESGAVSLDLRYRYTAYFSVAVGMNHFYGPGDSYIIPIGLGALGESNQTYQAERFSRLNAVREKDELFVRLRYTF